jgi:hypothetical protein
MFTAIFGGWHIGSRQMGSSGALSPVRRIQWHSAVEKEKHYSALWDTRYPAMAQNRLKPKWPPPTPVLEAVVTQGTLRYLLAAVNSLGYKECPCSTRTRVYASYLCELGFETQGDKTIGR